MSTPLGWHPHSRGLRDTAAADLARQDSPLESRKLRYGYGPWDPSYYAVLGSLVGRHLIEIVPAEGSHALGCRTTGKGEQLARELAADGAFDELIGRVTLLRRHLDLTGESLKKLLFEIPGVADASWHEEIR